MAATAMKLYLFGQFRLEGPLEPVRLSAARRLIALLCLKPGASWPREQLALHVWPTSDGHDARVRLRTTLAEARRALGESVTWEGGRSLLRLVPNGLQVDLWEAQAEVRRIAVAPDVVAEHEALMRLVELTSETLLPEMPAFLIHERGEWSQRTIEALIRLATIEEEREDPETASRFLEQALTLSPYNERIWMSLIRIHANLGRHVEVCDRFARVRQDLRRELGSDFSSSVRQLAQQVKRTGRSSSTLTAEQTDMIARTFTRQLETAPLRAADVLGSEEFRMEVFRSPASAANLLERVLEATTGGSAARMQCAVYAMMAHTLTGRDERLLSLGHEITAHDSDSTRLRAAETMLAGTYINNGEYELALASYERALTHAIAVGNTPGIDLVLAQRAILEWEMGSAEGTRTLLEEIEGRLSQYDEHNAKTGRGALNTYIGLIHLYDDEPAKAEAHFRRAIGLAQETNHTSASTIVRPGLGLALILLGQTQEGMDHAKQGLAGVYRLKSKRLTLLAIDYCARGLLELGRKTQAAALVDRTEALRLEAKIPISATHERFCTRICAGAGVNSASTIPLPDDSIRALVSDTLSILQEADFSA